MKSFILSSLLGGLLAASGCAQPAAPGTGDQSGTGAPSSGGGAGTGGSSAGAGGGAAGTGAAGSGAAGHAGSTGGGNTAGTSAAGTTGTAGTSGAAGTGAAATCSPGAPTAASGGAAFPFPQHRLSAACGYPTMCTDTTVMTAWTLWKSTEIVAAGSNLRVQRPENSNDTVSEGIGYGMLGAVYMNDKTTFDKLWAYEQTGSFQDSHGLMNWQINSSGSVQSTGSATDGDEDMAFALVMADKQWGGYTSTATGFLGKVFANDFKSNLPTIGDQDTSGMINISFLAPAYYRVFAAYDTADASGWNASVDASYSLLTQCENATTGLVPQYCKSGQQINDYQADACRTPFRIGLDACWNNEPRAKTYLAKVEAFFAGQGINGIHDEYNLNGTVVGTGTSSLSFIGPAIVSAMPSDSEPFLDQGYAKVQQLSVSATEPGYNYYNGAWGVLSLLFLTGNFVNFNGL